MKKLLAKLRTRSFWVALVGALTLIFSRLGLEDAPALAQKITETAASLLLLFGIAVSPAAIADKGEACDDEADERETNDGDETNDGTTLVTPSIAEGTDEGRKDFSTSSK